MSTLIYPDEFYNENNEECNKESYSKITQNTLDQEFRQRMNSRVERMRKKYREEYRQTKLGGLSEEEIIQILKEARPENFV